MGGCFNVNYTGENITTSSISTTTNYEDGSKTTVTLSKNSSCKLYKEANIYLHTNNNTTAPIETIPALKYKLYNGSSQISEGTITNKNDYLLGTVPLTDTSTTYTVYLYIDPSISIGNYNGTSYSGYIYADSHQTSTIEGNYLVSFDKGNLLYGLEDVGETSEGRMKYSINNEVVTVTATMDDGYGFTKGRVNLEANKTYRFAANTDSTWGGGHDDTVESCLMLNGQYNRYYCTNNSNMNNNGYHEFTPTESGVYWLRLDVNQSGQTHTFSNISITEKESSMQTKTVTVGQNYGWLPTPERVGYTFKGWNGKNLFSGFNKNVSISSIDGTEGSYPYGAATDFIEIDFDESNYYISGLTDRLYIFWAYYDENYNYLGRVGAAGRTGSIVAKNRDIVTSSEKEKFLRFYIYQNQNVPGVIDEIDDLNIQFEKGTKTTTFEPYIVINDTDVTQMKNHTLTAIWEKNN